MADRIVAVMKVFSRAVRFGTLYMLLCSALALAGCQAVTMPDMSDFKLKIFEEKPLVAIKPGYSKVNIRPIPSTEKAPVATLKGGDKLTLHEEQGNWLKVTFYDTTGNEQAGWIYKYLVEGYNKQVDISGPSGKATQSSVREEPIATDMIEVEQETNEQELPKSQSVSPL